MIKRILRTACAIVSLTILAINACEVDASQLQVTNSSSTVFVEGDSGDFEINSNEPIIGISVKSNGEDVVIKVVGITVYKSTKSKLVLLNER